MASPSHPDQLVISLEPEAASIYCRRLRMTQLVPDTPPSMPPLTLERNKKLVEMPETVQDFVGDHLSTGGKPCICYRKFEKRTSFFSFCGNCHYRFPINPKFSINIVFVCNNHKPVAGSMLSLACFPALICLCLVTTLFVHIVVVGLQSVLMLWKILSKVGIISITSLLCLVHVVCPTIALRMPDAS